MSKFWTVNVGHLLTIGTIVVAMAAAWGRFSEQIARHEAQLRQHADRLTTLETGGVAREAKMQTQVNVIANDVEWIRRSLETLTRNKTTN